MKQEMIQKPTPPAGALVRLLTGALIALTTLAACHNELEDDHITATRTVTLSVSMPDADGTQTRVAYNGDLKLTWQEGDRLMVYDQPGNTLLGTLTIAGISSNGTNAKFTGNVTTADKYSLRYAPAGADTPAQAPAPDAAGATTPGQVQKGNANTDHMRSLLGLSADNVTSLTDPVTLKLDAAVLTLSITGLTDEQKTDLGTLQSLQWKSETINGLAGSTTHTMTLGLKNVTPDAADGSITAYIAFRPGDMSLARSSMFSITLTGTGDARYIATTRASLDGKTYEPGKRYTVALTGTSSAGVDALLLLSRRVKGDGTKELGKEFNAQSPEWVISGGGTETNATVLANVKAALEALPADTKTIELTLTGVTELPGSAFSDARKKDALASINLPEATTIGESAFNGCKSLASVKLPKATTIGKQAFQSCTSLTSIDLSGAKTIVEHAFDNCTALAAIDLPEATAIGGYAFYECKALATVKLPLVESIGGFAFYSCWSISSLILPKVTKIGEQAFDLCTALKDLKLTAAGEITLIKNAFYALSTTACDLVLNSDKQPGVATDGGKIWGGKTWKSITYTTKTSATRRRSPRNAPAPLT